MLLAALLFAVIVSGHLHSELTLHFYIIVNVTNMLNVAHPS